MYLYGLHVPALGPSHGVVGPRALAWYDVTLNQRLGDAPTATDVQQSDRRATFTAADEFAVAVSRGGEVSVCVTGPRRVDPARLAHPVMSFVGAVVAWWVGRLSLHAAAVVLDGHAWVLSAPPECGKSTLAAALAERGHAVLSDDLTVIDGRTVLAGPRSADLRAESADHFGLGEEDFLPQRGRWRKHLGPVPYEVPLGGFIELQWGGRHAVAAADAATRLRLLARAEALRRGPVTPQAFLDVLDVPTYVLHRPRQLSGLAETVSMVEAIGRDSSLV